MRLCVLGFDSANKSGLGVNVYWTYLDNRSVILIDENNIKIISYSPHMVESNLKRERIKMQSKNVLLQNSFLIIAILKFISFYRMHK